MTINHFFYQPTSNKQEAYKKLAEMSKMNFLFYQKYYKLIGIDFSRQTNTRNFQEANFPRQLDKDVGKEVRIMSRKESNLRQFILRTR